MKRVHSLRRDRMKKGIYVLPNLFTTANLFCGFYAAIASMKGMYEIAAVAILIAAVSFCGCGALRLARFNVQVGVIDSRVFNGLPIPGGAAVVATGVLLYYYMGGEGRFSELPI